MKEDSLQKNMIYDVLREIGTIGTGNAMTALSELTQTKIDMSVPKVSFLGLNEFVNLIGGPENTVVGILISLSGDIEGMMMFLLEEQAAHSFIQSLLMNYTHMEWEGTKQESFGEIDLSALNEIGNIIASVYLSSLSELTNLKIISSIPYMTVDMAGAILSVPAIEFGKIGDKALVIRSEFHKNQERVSGYFILIPTVDSYHEILHALGL